MDRGTPGGGGGKIVLRAVLVCEGWKQALLGGGGFVLVREGWIQALPGGGGQFWVTVTHIFFVFTGLKTVFAVISWTGSARAPLKTGAHAAPPRGAGSARHTPAPGRGRDRARWSK